MTKGLVGGWVLYTDSTHLKASVNSHKSRSEQRAVPPGAYFDALDKVVNEDRVVAGKKSEASP